MFIFYIAVCDSVKMILIIKDVLHTFIVFIQEGSFRFMDFNFYYIDKLILGKVWNIMKKLKLMHEYIYRIKGKLVL